MTPRAAEVFEQNDGEVTKAYYAKLNSFGQHGQIAVALFRCQKRSTAAKRYKRGRFKHAAYDVKNWSMGELCRLLKEHAATLGIAWGWKEDPKTPGYEWVLYVELPQGQVSFHGATRGLGPDYRGDWDGQRLSRERILGFCDPVIQQPYPQRIQEAVR